MKSTAILSQFSTFEVAASGAAGSVPITGITVANPAVFTSVAHGFVNGDVVTIADVVGMVQVNGKSGIVTGVTADAFSITGLDSTGYTPYVSGGTAGAVGWTKIANIKTFSGFDGAAANIDVSNIQSDAKEYLTGLKDEGQFSLELDLDTADPGQNALLAARTASAMVQFRLTLPNATTAVFSGIPKKITASGGVDSQMKRSVDILISGAVVWSNVP